MQTVLEQEFLLERALIVGMGPIGILHALVLSQRGVHVWFIDSVPNRIILAQHILGKRAQAFNPDRHDADFDLVVVTAATGAALRKGEELVGSGGCLYVFSGLNRVDRAMTDRSGLFQLEAIHRAAQGLLIAPAFSHTRKRIFYLGSSGYFGGLMGEAIATVAANARELQLAVTGVIRGLPSPYIEARLPGAENQVTDGSPAIIATLNGSFDLRERHVKVLLILGHQPTGEV